MKYRNLIPKLALVLFTVTIIIGYQNCGNEIPQNQSAEKPGNDDRDILRLNDINLTEAKVILGEDELQAEGTCHVKNDSRGDIKWIVTKNSCSSCDPYIFTQRDSCNNGSFYVNKALSGDMGGALLSDTYTVKVELTSEGASLVKDTIRARVKEASGGGIPTLHTNLSTSDTAILGTTYTMTVGATGSGTITYEWFKEEGGTWQNLGESSNILTIGSVSASDAGRYKAKVSLQGGGSVESNVLELSVTGSGGGSTERKVFYSSYIYTGKSYKAGDGFCYSEATSSCPDGYTGVSAAIVSTWNPSDATCKCNRSQYNVSRNVMEMAPVKDSSGNILRWKFKTRCMQSKHAITCLKNQTP